MFARKSKPGPSRPGLPKPGLPKPGPAAARRRAAAGRLETARRGFERSIVALRTAALDHVDSQTLASLTLRLVLDRHRARCADGRAA